MAKQFLANQVIFKQFELNPPMFAVKLKGRIDGKGEETEIDFSDEEGTPEDLLIVRHILGLLNASYRNAKARSSVGHKKFYTIALTVDDAGENLLPPVAETPPAKGGGSEAKIEVERTVVKETTKVTVSESPAPKPEARGPHGP